MLSASSSSFRRALTRSTWATIGLSAATRHWELWELYVRECYHRMIISVHKVDTDDEFADVLTKAIPKEDEKFGRFCATLLNLPR